jgi:ABC-type molybdate transport system substrate-binding protein
MKKTLFLSLVAAAIFAKEQIVVFHAGSLSVPFSQIEKKFEAKYPQYDVVREAAGSRACARKITDLHKKADVMASADYKVIDNLLMPKYAKFNALFATNEMVIAFTPHSKYSNKINSNNWTDILLKPGVKVGHSNPNLDPCGYRSVLVTKLAGIYYNKPDFYNKLLGYGDFYTNGEENRNKVIVRPKETDLLGLLEAGAFETFIKIVIPNAKKDIINGMLMMWARGLGEFGAVVILSYHPMIAPVLIYDRFINFGLNYSAPVAALMIIFSVIIFLSIRWLNNRFSRH